MYTKKLNEKAGVLEFDNIAYHEKLKEISSIISKDSIQTEKLYFLEENIKKSETE